MSTSLKTAVKSAPKADLIALLLSFMDMVRGHLTAELPDSCSFMHVKALDFIVKSKEPSMSEIAGFLKITSPGATLVVDKLVENLELERHADPDDRRIVRLGITAKGKKTLESGMKIVKKQVAVSISSLNKSEQKELGSIMNKIIKSKN